MSAYKLGPFGNDPLIVALCPSLFACQITSIVVRLHDGRLATRFFAVVWLRSPIQEFASLTPREYGTREECAEKTVAHYHETYGEAIYKLTRSGEGLYPRPTKERFL